MVMGKLLIYIYIYKHPMYTFWGQLDNGHIWLWEWEMLCVYILSGFGQSGHHDGAVWLVTFNWSANLQWPFPWWWCLFAFTAYAIAGVMNSFCRDGIVFYVHKIKEIIWKISINFQKKIFLFCDYNNSVNFHTGVSKWYFNWNHKQDKKKLRKKIQRFNYK